MAVVGIKKGRKEVTVAFLHIGSFHFRLTLRINITDAIRTFSGYHLVAYVTIYSISGSGLGVYAYIYNTTIIIEMLHFKSK